MAKRKATTTEAEPRKYGTMVRLGDNFAEALRKACALEGVSAAEFADTYLMGVVEKRYHDLLTQELKLRGGSK